MNTVQYLARNGKAGFKSHGVARLDPPTHGMHMDRALWLISQIEMPGGFGQIQNCHDKAVMSGGVLHHIAVQPKSQTQGSLWPLVVRMAQASRDQRVQALLSEIDSMGWIFGGDGYLRDKKTGALVRGRDITNEICQSGDAVVPEPGQPGHDRAKPWAQLFADAFSAADTYSTQLWYAAEWLLRGNSTDETLAYVRLTGDKSITGDRAAHRTDLPDFADLAMCVYHCFSTNAPDTARTVLSQTLNKELKGEDFALKLVKSLGTNNYKNWKDRDDGTSRYDRTRSHAERSGLWDAALVARMLPENFRDR
jgi:hypothetical protein